MEIDSLIALTEEVRIDSHRVYLDNWETKTQFAENGGKWTEDIQHRNHEAIEKMSSNVETLAVALSAALLKIDELTKTIENLTK